MGSRYLVTGVQMGMIKGFLSALQKIKVEAKEPNETDKIIDNIEEVIDEVLEKQHIGSSHNIIDKDIVDFNKYLNLLHFQDLH